MSTDSLELTVMVVCALIAAAAGLFTWALVLWAFITNAKKRYHEPGRQRWADWTLGAFIILVAGIYVWLCGGIVYFGFQELFPRP